MSATNWKDTLGSAAECSGDARSLVEPVIELLERSLGGSYSEADVATVFDAQMFKVPFVVAVENAAQGADRRQWPAERLAAVRAVLSVLPALLDRLATISVGQTAPPDAVTEALEGMAALAHNDPAAEQTARQRWRPGDPMCPRCGSTRVLTQHTSATGERVYETRCEACHNYDSWHAGDRDDHKWSESAATPGDSPAPTADVSAAPVAAEDADTATLDLAAPYIAYLQDRKNSARTAALVDALRSAGEDSRAELLASWLEGKTGPLELGREHGPWAGRRTWLGESLPTEADEGDLWFDPCELGLMMLVPREGLARQHGATPDRTSGQGAERSGAGQRPEHSIEELPPGTSKFLTWLSVETVARWQFWACLQLVPFERREVMERPPLDILSAQRISREPEIEPITGICWGEAFIYASWFCKGLPSMYGWQSAADLLPEQAFSALWGPLPREWVSDTVESDETARVVVTRDTYHLDPDEVYEEEYEGAKTPAGPMVVGQWQQEAELGFRTAVTVQLGLVEEWSELGTRIGDWQLLGKLRRAGR